MQNLPEDDQLVTSVFLEKKEKVEESPQKDDETSQHVSPIEQLIQASLSNVSLISQQQVPPIVGIRQIGQFASFGDQLPTFHSTEKEQHLSQQFTPETKYSQNIYSKAQYSGSVDIADILYRYRIDYSQDIQSSKQVKTGHFQLEESDKTAKFTYSQLFADHNIYDEVQELFQARQESLQKYPFKALSLEEIKSKVQETLKILTTEDDFPKRIRILHQKEPNSEINEEIFLQDQKLIDKIHQASLKSIYILLSTQDGLL